MTREEMVEVVRSADRDAWDTQGRAADSQEIVDALITAGALRPTPAKKGEAVRVRMAVAVTTEGDWAVAGGSHHSTQPLFPDDSMREEALEELKCDAGLSIKDALVTFVEADVPLPKPPEEVTVEGEVVESKVGKNPT